MEDVGLLKAVLWDFGGVLTTSPFEAFKRFERENNLPENFIRTVNATRPDTNSWARFERNEITFEEFDREFERETRAAGHAIRGVTALGLIAGDLRPEMVEALRRCQSHFRTACLTNNMNVVQIPGWHVLSKRATAFREVMGLFDLVIESSKIGIRKPDPEFYRTACEMLKISPNQAVYLDDLGVNLKPARALGMITIKVTDPARALKELESVLQIPLRS
jgi:putative hydrolase of the HAD superfamily